MSVSSCGPRRGREGVPESYKDQFLSCVTGGLIDGLFRKFYKLQSLESKKNVTPLQDSCVQSCFGILITFSVHLVWVYEEPAELVVAPFLSLLEFVQRIFLH